MQNLTLEQIRTIRATLSPGLEPGSTELLESALKRSGADLPFEQRLGGFLERMLCDYPFASENGPTGLAAGLCLCLINGYAPTWTVDEAVAFATAVIHYELDAEGAAERLQPLPAGPALPFAEAFQLVQERYGAALEALRGVE